MVAIATSRDRTLQSGKLLLLDLNGSEVNSTPRDLTPLVPGGEDPSSLGVGRYYDAEPVGQSAPGRFLVSWADGPVESETLALAGTNAQFGVYVYDMNSRQRFPIYDALNYWDILARPLKARPEPQGSPLTPVSPLSAQDTTIGALNVYDSSLGNIKDNLTPGSVVKVRLIEGFSGEEGGVDMFGTTEFDGQSLYGEVDVKQRRLVRGGGPRQRAVPHPAGRQARPQPGQRVDLDQRPRRRAALLRRLPREPHQDRGAHPRHPAERAGGRRQPRGGAAAAQVGRPRSRSSGGIAHQREHAAARRSLGHGHPAHPRRQVRELPQRRRHERGEPELHHHRQRDGHVADVHLRPSRSEDRRDHRRTRDG